jgi:hypothetical protein
MHYDYYANQEDAAWHGDPANDGKPCPIQEEDGLDSYLGTLCEVHLAQASELFGDNSIWIACDNPFCRAECCVCVAE